MPSAEHRSIVRAMLVACSKENPFSISLSRGGAPKFLTPTSAVVFATAAGCGLPLLLLQPRQRTSDEPCGGVMPIAARVLATAAGCGLPLLLQPRWRVDDAPCGAPELLTPTSPRLFATAAAIGANVQVHLDDFASKLQDAPPSRSPMESERRLHGVLSISAEADQTTTTCNNWRSNSTSLNADDTTPEGSSRCEKLKAKTRATAKHGKTTAAKGLDDVVSNMENE
eukprot:CAMPEP_0203916444 /NCGR_PEP_ID=MMETSP0359-20131031/57156_1 /ASSEMBLY_ACC=CAM_ASM_000338 /TAXON_ID=268821 /ORGANISM="Scrippsiella Hangoei, Strain SHTV-5" /LENGTH=225 /DNA_ID=CAMNT_0050843151 /DNA_START=45 /DNA_END=725 /DNA_ORIENTATION=-